MSGGAIPVSRYTSSTLVDLRHPVIALHAVLSILNQVYERDEILPRLVLHIQQRNNMKQAFVAQCAVQGTPNYFGWSVFSSSVFLHLTVNDLLASLLLLFATTSSVVKSVKVSIVEVAKRTN